MKTVITAISVCVILTVGVLVGYELVVPLNDRRLNRFRFEQFFNKKKAETLAKVTTKVQSIKNYRSPWQAKVNDDRTFINEDIELGAA
jgi:GTP-sensing pleiotropic transcriptional regulator CodY